MLLAKRELHIHTNLNGRLESDRDHIKRVCHYKMYRRKDSKFPYIRRKSVIDLT